MRQIEHTNSGGSRLPLAAVCLGMLPLGIAAGGLIGIGGSQGSGTQESVAMVVPSARAEGVAVGWPSNCKGAGAAAASYVQAFGSSELALDLNAARRAVKQLATPELSARLIPALKEAIGPYANGAIGSDWRSGIETLQITVPLAYSEIKCAAAEKASVRLWAVTLRGTASAVWPMQFWDTHQIDLTWQSDDWKVSGGTQQPGPVPHLAQGPLPHRKNQTAVMDLARNMRPFQLTP